MCEVACNVGLGLPEAGVRARRCLVCLVCWVFFGGGVIQGSEGLKKDVQKW